MFKSVLISLLLIFSVHLAFAAIPSRDSLIAQYAETPVPTVPTESYLLLLRNLGISWGTDNADSAGKYLDQFQQAARLHGSHEYFVQSCRFMGAHLRRQGQLEAAVQNYLQAWEVIKDKPADQSTISLLGDIASIYYDAGFFQAAKRYRWEQLALTKTLKREPRELVGILGNLGFACMELGQTDSTAYDSAAYYFNRHLQLSTAALDTFNVGVANDYLGLLSLEVGDLDQAEVHFRNTARIMKLPRLNFPDQNQKSIFYGRALYGLGKVYTRRENADSIFWFTEAAEKAWETALHNQSPKLATIQVMQGRAYELRGDPVQAEKHLLRGQEMAATLGTGAEKQNEVHAALAAFYARQGKWDKAYAMQQKLTSYEKSCNLSTDKWVFFSSHSDLTNSGLAQQLDLEQKARAQAIRIRNLSIAAVIAVSLLFLLVLLLLRNLRKSNRQNRENAAELRALNQTQNTLMSVLAHDLRSPFHSILGLSKQVEHQIEAKNWNRVTSSFRIIREASREAYHLFENLLDWARSQSDRRTFEPVELDLSQVIEETVKSVKGLAQTKQMQLIFEVDYQAAVGDQRMVTTILRNLLSNAIKFSPSGSTVEIRVRRQGERLEIEVLDEGPGLSPQQLARVNSPEMSMKGAGLGLILCREFAEAHAGQLQVRPQAGKGTCISFSLPVGSHIVPENPTRQIWNLRAASSSEPPLTSDWEERLFARYPEFRQLKIYENSKAKKLMQALEDGDSPELQLWKNKLNQAMDDYDEGEFARLTGGPREQIA